MPQENHDHYQYNWISFYRETVEFLFEAIKFYEGLLVKEDQALNENPHLKGFLNEDLKREFGISTNLNKATRIKDWLEMKLNQNAGKWDIDLDMSHGTVRLLKSVGFLYLGFLKQQRNEISKDPNCSNNLLAALDRGISSQEDKLNNYGIFKNASRIPLTIDQAVVEKDTPETASNNDASISKSERPRPQVINSIELLDSELRKRCLDLFSQFEEAGEPDRHDTVIAEATRILEDRLRKLTHTNDNANALKLVTRAFDEKNPMIKASTIQGEQEGAQQLFRGVFGYIRNQYQHKLIKNTSPERTLQVLGMIDFLIGIIDSSTIENSQIINNAQAKD